ncbi:4'-phosphopantetheinyl transferase, partial [Bacillus thuringiensis]
MPCKKKSDIEREQASSMVKDWEKDNGGLDDNQRATLQRMIELKSNTAQQDVRRVDYYSGNEKKYERSTQPIQVRNENTGSLVKKKKEIFALKNGEEDEPVENVYQNLEFDKNNEDHRKPPERNPFLDQIKAAKSISQSTSTDWMKQQEEASRTNRMMSTIDRIAKQPPSQEGVFLDDLKFAAGKFGEMIKPPEGKTRQEVWDEYMKDGGKSRGTKEVNRFANRTMDSTLLNAPSAAMKKVRGQDAVDWQDHREGVGENIADFVSTGIGYVLPGAGAANVAGKLGMAAKVGENTSKLGKIGKYAKEGAVTGALIAGAETPAKAYVNPEQTVGDHLKRIGVETAAGAAITPLAHGLMNAVQNLRKTKGHTSNVADDFIQQERQQRELVNQAVEEQVLQDTRIKNKLIQAASEFTPSLEQAIESVAKQKKKSSSNGELPDDVQAMRNAPPVIQSAMAPDGRTITQKKLMDSFRDNVGITLRTGRMGVGDDAVSGIYKNSPEVIRTRDYGDLETLAHETGHHLDKKFGLNDPKFDDELMKLGSHISGQNYTPEQIRQEGMAEFMRRYLLNPAMAEQEAPTFMKHFQNTIPEDVQKGLKKVQEDAQIWVNQGDEARFRGKINVNEKPKNLSEIFGIIYVKRMFSMIHNYTSNITREQFEVIREDLENAR